MGKRNVTNFIYFLLRNIVFLLLIQNVSSNLDLDSSCKQEWVRVQRSKSEYQYSFRVDCANLGFEDIPSGLPRLTSELLLNGNSISSLDDQALAGLTTLHALDLSGNDIVTLNESVFNNIKQLKRLDLSRNKIKCDTRIWWLVKFSKTLANFTGECFSPRPLRTRSITALTEEDLAVDCLSVKQLHDASEDGEYNIRVFARDNSQTELCIYCYQMRSSKPKEFLTLPAGVHHNYVKIRMDDECNYTRDAALHQKLPFLKQNTSYFVRVRIILTSLTIITTDTTFGSNSMIKYGQPGLCGDNVCTGGMAKIDLRGTHFHIKENRKIITTRKCDAEKCKMCNVSNNIALSMMDQRKYPYLACTLPLGLQNGHIQNASINASSSYPGYKPYHARLNSLAYSGWCAESMDQAEYIRFDLGVVKTLSGISTQGHKTENNWVTRYHVFYSKNSNELTKYKEFGKDIVLLGNQDSNTVATHWFQPRFRARYIVVRPLTWNGNETNGNKICMRIELYGCENDITSYIIKPQLSNKCLTIDINNKTMKEGYPLVMGTGCSGPAYMFTFSTRRLMHTQSGMCMYLSDTNELILNKHCSSSNIQFQKVRHKHSREAFLIKDKDKCARIYNNDKAFQANMQILWSWCLKGGFTILFMSRAGVASFPPNFANTVNNITTDLFKHVKFECRVHADPLTTFRWSKHSLDGPVFNNFENGIVSEKKEFSTLKFNNISWEDRGTYYCNAWNSKGNAYRKYDINVNAMQWWNRRPTDQKIIWGTSAVFHCISRGIPTPNVRWAKFNDASLQNPVSINYNHSRYFILENSTLVINKVVYRDEGIYMCISTSPKLIRNVSASLDVYVTQKFTAVPESKHVLFGEGTIFKCVSEGEPKPEVQWKMDLNVMGGLVSIEKPFQHQYEILPDNSLFVKQVTPTDEGRFYCISESPGLVVNVSAALTVYVTQNFTKAPIDQKVLYGYNASFECVSIGVPPPKVSWVKVEGRSRHQLFSNHKYIITSNNTLHIIDVRYEDEGKYICFSQSPRLERNVSAILDVYVTQNFTMSPVNQKILYGYNATFDCLSIGIPKPKVSWYKKVKDNLQVLNSNGKHVITTNALHIFNVNYDDEGEYICDSESPRLKRNVSAYLDVYVTQNFTTSPTDVKVLYDYNARFECVAVGIPKPVVSWARKMESGYEKLTSNAKFEVTGESLTIFKAKYEDEREYICLSESPRLRKNATAALDVYVTQNFDIKPRGKRVLYGDNYTLYCSSTGIPKPKVTWKFKHFNSESPVWVKNTSKHVLDANGTLSLYDVALEQSGEYYCVSQSPGYITNVSAQVVVYVTQKFTKEPKSQKLIKGQEAKFHCESLGSPTPVIYWKYKKMGVNTLIDINQVVNDRIILHSEKSLIIKDIQNEDEGDYVCVSESPGLLVNRTARLIVYIKPLINLSRTSKHLYIGQSVSVRCKVSGDPLPTINWYKIVNGERTSLSYTDEELWFRQVKKKSQGKYKCEAINDVGVVEATFDLRVTATCLLTLIENSQHYPNRYEYKEGEKVSVKCKRGFHMGRRTNLTLTCMYTGKFDYPIPTCEDINECNDTRIIDIDPGSGIGQEDLITEQSDDEPEVCDYNGQCINTIGSFKCVCDEGYVMLRNKCEFAPPGSKSNRPAPGSTRPPTTAPPAQNYKWLHSLNSYYRRDLMQEEKYLSSLRKLSSSITRKHHDSWKVDGIKQVLVSLKLAVDLADKNVRFATARRSMEAIRAFGAIVSDILNTELKKQWWEINKEMNGSVLVMKYLEEYILVKTEVLTMKDFKAGPMVEFFSNLNVKIVPVKEEYKDKPLEIAMLQGDEGNIIDIPVENYVKFKDTVGIAILYKTLHDLFPIPNMEVLKRAKIQSKMFTLSFSPFSRAKLIKPIHIKFKLNVKEKIPDKRLCSFWDFEEPYGGGWSTDGCEPLNISSASEVICECTHLSNFAIIVPERTAQKVAYLTFTLSVAVGVTACIILAFCTCMSHICCSSYTAGDRQCIMTNITVVIILGLMVFAGGVFVSSMELITDAYSTYFCFSLIGIIQLLAVACFGWIFAESIHILFSTRPVIEKRSSNLCLFYILGWVVPVGLLVITGVLVYLDKFQLQSRCSLKVSFYLVGILVGAPSVCYIIATFVVYIIICISTSKNVEILGSMKVSHARRSLLCSGVLILFHLALLGAVTLYLHFNGEAMFHHILGGVAAAEGIYLIIYHMFLDRMAGKSKTGSPRTRQRNSYSTKETITNREEVGDGVYTTYAPNGSIGNEESNSTEQTRFLIKTSSKRSSVDNTKPTPPQLRTPDEPSTLEWDSHVGGDMYGESQSSPTDIELKPILSKHISEDLPPTIYEEEKDYSIETGLDTFGKPNVERNDTLPRSYSSLPRKKQMTRDFDEVSADGSFRPKRPPVKSNSIVSIETHTSTSSQQGLPVYFPSAPPHHEIYFDEKKKPESVHSNDNYLESTNTSRPASFGIDSDRMSNLSSELSNILYELQAFNTDRHPSESQSNVYEDDNNANTLPHRHSEGAPDLSKTHSTFKPGRAYAKTEVQFDSTKPPTIEHHRVRVLRGRSRAEADPSDGLHGNSDSIYSSL